MRPSGTIRLITIGFTGTGKLVWVRNDPAQGFDDALRVQATAGGPITTVASGIGDVLTIAGSSKIFAFTKVTNNPDADVSIVEP